MPKLEEFKDQSMLCSYGMHKRCRATTCKCKCGHIKMTAEERAQANRIFNPPTYRS